MADILQITLPDGTTYDLKDSTAVTNIAYDSSTYNITKTINGTTTNVYQLPIIAGTGTNSLLGGNLSLNVASGEGSVCLGTSFTQSETTYTSTASGKYSFVAGAGNTASGDSTSVFGIHNTVSGQFSTAIGANNTTTGQASFVGGGESNITSAAHYSLCFGYQNETQGIASVALGGGTKAKGATSMAIGQTTIASAACSFVSGLFNIEDTGTASDNPFNKNSYKKYAFIIGNGTASSARSNALTVDWYGSIESGGSITLGYGGNDATTLTAAQLKTLISTGTTDQILTKTASGFAWQSLPTYNGSVS